MHSDHNGRGFALLFFPGKTDNTFAMHVSSPPPTWLESGDMTKIAIAEAGIYCLFFLVLAREGGRAYITVNGREIRGSYAEAKGGAVSGSAVCSIREPALPCDLGINTEGGTEEGLMLVFRYEV